MLESRTAAVAERTARKGRGVRGRKICWWRVLTWVMQRRIVLAERVEQLRKELAETEAEVARLEAAEVVIGQFIEAERAGEVDDAGMDAVLERVTVAPGAGGMLLVPAA